MFRHSSLAMAVAVVALLLPALVVPAAAATPVLMDSIAPGLVRGTDGFGSSTVLVPKQGYVTYLVRTDSRLKGKHVQIWTNTGAGWKLTSTRVVETGGTVHYFARITRRTAFWAKYADVKPADVSHGRVAGVSTDGTTTIRVGCDEVGPVGSGVKSLVSRRVGTKVTGTIRVTVCSNPSTGFVWGLLSLDTRHLMRVGHTTHPGRPAGVAGTETWSVRVTDGGTGRATYVYSQPWQGGEKAVWMLTLTVEAS
jgi:predicted secreted protein